MLIDNKKRKKKGRVRVLSSEMAFCAWILTGSITRAIDYLSVNGIFNPSTGERYSRMAIWLSAKSSVFYKIYEAKRMKELGGTLNQDTPTTKEEYDFAVKYFNEHVEENATIVQKKYKEIHG